MSFKTFKLIIIELYSTFFQIIYVTLFDPIYVIQIKFWKVNQILI